MFAMTQVLCSIPPFYDVKLRSKIHTFSQQRRWDLCPSLTCPKSPHPFSPAHTFYSASQLQARLPDECKTCHQERGEYSPRVKGGRFWKPRMWRASACQSCNSALSPRPTLTANLLYAFQPFYFPPNAVFLSKDSMTHAFSNRY